ncbi:MAG: flavin reductase, partial [Halanaerobium sp.]|nr:flavin reductase [Halanaerobium sp.]
MIAEAPVNIECRVVETISLGSHDYFIGEVVAIHAEETALQDNGNKIKPDNLLLYGGRRYLSPGKTVGEFGFSLKDARGSEK